MVKKTDLLILTICKIYFYLKVIISDIIIGRIKEIDGLDRLIDYNRETGEDMKDSFGREINYLRISLTDRCNLRCKYCMPEGGIEKFHHEDMLSLEEVYEISRCFVELGVNKIRLTGGEPLVRKGIVDLISQLSSLEGVKEVTMTTNGLLLDKYAEELKEAGLNRLNISLDSLNREKYRKITRGGDLDTTWRGIRKAMDLGLSPIKINTVLIGGFNDDELEDLVYLTEKEDIDVRFIELMPIGEAAGWAKERFIPSSRVLDRVKELRPIGKEDPSSPANYYKLPGARGRVGLINPISCKFCANCNRVRLTSQGRLKLCLHSNREIDLKEAMARGENLRDLIIKSIGEKEEAHQLDEGKYINRNMNQIGG